MAFSLFTGIRRKIILSNLVVIPLFFIGLLMFNYTHASLIAIRLQSLQQQAEMISSILTARPLGHYNPKIEKLVIGQNGFFLRQPLIPQNIHARLFDEKGRLLDDSHLHPPGVIEAFKLPPLQSQNLVKRYWAYMKFYLIHLFYKLNDIHHIEYSKQNFETHEKLYEVLRAYQGHSVSAIRVNPETMTLSVAVPIRYLEKVLGVLHLSVSGKEITSLMAQDRNNLLWFFLAVSLMSMGISLLLARHILVPLLVLVRCVQHLHKTSFRPLESQMHIIKSLSKRTDEIGTLARKITDMINTIQKRISESENFAADVSHELKNPLTSLKNALETLELISDTQKRKRLLDIIYHDLRRIDRLIGDISKISRIDGQMQREIMEAILVQDYLQQIIAHYQDTQDKENIRLCLINHTEKNFKIMGLPERLNHVFCNLIDNALSVTPCGGRIDIILELHTESLLKITVKDTGTGIPEDMLERIFERFYSHRPLERQFGNHSGLGLAIVKQIIIGHQGTIQAKNHYHPDGQVAGAIFEIIIPLIK